MSRRVLPPLMLCLLTVCAVVACASSSGSRTSRKHFDRATAFYATGRYDDAITEYQLALFDSPDMVQAHFSLSVAYLQTGFYKGAVLALNEAIARQPNFPKAHHNLGMAHFHLEHYPEARRSFKNALHQDPAFADARFGLGQTLEALGETDRAVSLFDQMLADSSEARVHGALADIHEKRGDVDRASEHLRVLAPDDHTHWVRLVNMYERAERFGEAAEACRRAIEAQLESTSLLTRLAHFLYLSGDFAESLRVYTNLVGRGKGDAKNYYNLGVTLDAMDDRSAAIDAYREAVRLDTEMETAWLNLATDLLESRAFEQALSVYKRYLQLAQESVTRNRVEETVDKLQKALGLASD